MPKIKAKVSLLVFIVAWNAIGTFGETGNNNAAASFATTVYKALAEGNTEDNFVFCPFCLTATVAMISLGVERNNASDLRKSVELPWNETRLLETFKESLQSYKHLRSLRMFNGLVLDNSEHANVKFDAILSNYFGQHLNFFPPGMTRDHAVQMLVEDSLNIRNSDEAMGSFEDTSPSKNSGITIVNYLDFYGTWEKRFETLSTSEEPFVVSPSEIIMVKMMRQKGHFHVAHLSELKVKALSMPYLLCAGNIYGNMRNRTSASRVKQKKTVCKSGVRDSRFHLVVLMPYETDGMRRLEENLSGELVKNVLGKFQYKNYLDLSFPSFKIKSKGDLIEPLHKILPADLRYSGVSKTGPLALESVLQSVTVTIGERGSKTRSSLLKGPNLQARMLKINRPFIAFIHDRRLDLVLSMFRVLRPQSS